MIFACNLEEVQRIQKHWPNETPLSFLMQCDQDCICSCLKKNKSSENRCCTWSHSRCDSSSCTCALTEKGRKRIEQREKKKKQSHCMTGGAALNQNFSFMFKNISYILFGSLHTNCNCNLVEKKFSLRAICSQEILKWKCRIYFCYQRHDIVVNKNLKHIILGYILGRVNRMHPGKQEK